MQDLDPHSTILSLGLPKLPPFPAMIAARRGHRSLRPPTTIWRWLPWARLAPTPFAARGRPRKKAPSSLESDHALLGVAELFKVRLAGKLDHRRRAAHEHQRVIAGRRQVLLDHVRRNETRRVLPNLGWAVDGIPNLEAIGVLCSKALEHVAHQDVLLRLVGVDEGHLRRVTRILEDGGHHLQHRCDAGASCHHAKLFARVLLASTLEEPLALVLVGADRSLDVQLVTRLKRVHILRHLAAVRELLFLAALVHFDDKIDIPNLVV
mmetsp:Transcript_4240/g.11024  ORF Transcript_4240/g.11024 Transcript_4240/m.11024 type:complete len:265 (-) Transcript_4240:410-1204(-)